MKNIIISFLLATSFTFSANEWEETFELFGDKFVHKPDCVQKIYSDNLVLESDLGLLLSVIVDGSSVIEEFLNVNDSREVFTKKFNDILAVYSDTFVTRPSQYGLRTTKISLDHNPFSDIGITTEQFQELRKFRWYNIEIQRNKTVLDEIWDAYFEMITNYLSWSFQFKGQFCDVMKFARMRTIDFSSDEDMPDDVKQSLRDRFLDLLENGKKEGVDLTSFIKSSGLFD
ncbi:MAG: hypothetical protein KBD31_03170 [Proteobacteria bacterium]|nr:hypothetical protein [Pseudomonadota bacterium]